MLKSCKKGARDMRYTSAKSGSGTARSTVESPLQQATRLAVCWLEFIAKSRAASDAKNPSNDRGSSTAFPGTHTCIQNKKRASRSLPPPNGFRCRWLRTPAAMEEAGELQGLCTTHRRLGGAKMRPRKQSKLKTSHWMFPTGLLPSTAGHAHRPATREVGSARGGTWDVCEFRGG